MNEFSKYLNSIKVIILASILTVGVGFVSAQWQDPTVPPFGGNVDRPINVGTVSQTKTGSLWAGFLGSEGAGFINGNFEVGGTATIGGGNPGPGKYLKATDTAGSAVWAGPALICVKRQQAAVDAVGGPALSSVAVSCLPTEIRTGGGGNCGGGPVTQSMPGATDSEWSTQCDNSSANDSVTITSFAICCSVQ